MGYAEEPLPDPQQYLKKKSNDSTTVASAARKSFVYSFGLLDSCLS